MYRSCIDHVVFLTSMMLTKASFIDQIYSKIVLCFLISEEITIHFQDSLIESSKEHLYLK